MWLVKVICCELKYIFFRAEVTWLEFVRSCSFVRISTTYDAKLK